MVHANGGKGRALGILHHVRRCSDGRRWSRGRPFLSAKTLTRLRSLCRQPLPLHGSLGGPFKGAGTSNTVDGRCQDGTRVISLVETGAL
jgi:hypothetical protein